MIKKTGKKGTDGSDKKKTGDVKKAWKEKVGREER
jgi:hypothetical protein